MTTTCNRCHVRYGPPELSLAQKRWLKATPERLQRRQRRQENTSVGECGGGKQGGRGQGTPAQEVPQPPGGEEREQGKEAGGGRAP